MVLLLSALWLVLVQERRCLGHEQVYRVDRPMTDRLEWRSSRVGTGLGRRKLVTGILFGGAFLTLTVLAAPPPLPSLLAKGVNELRSRSAAHWWSSSPRS